MKNDRFPTQFPLLLVSLILLLTGCQTMPQMKQPMEKVKTFDAAFDEVWRASITALTTSNQMITLSEKDSGVIGVDRTFTKEQVWQYVLVDGWSKFWTQWTKFRSRANLVIQPVDQQRTKVTINSQIFGDFQEAHPNFLTGTVSYNPADRQLPSNGKLEKEYLDMIEGQIPSLRKIAWLDKSKENENSTSHVKDASIQAPAGIASDLMEVRDLAVATPVATVTAAVKSSSEIGSKLISAQEPPKDLKAERMKLEQEQERIAKEIELLHGQQQLEEEKQKLEVLKRERKEAGLTASRDESEARLQRMEKFKIESMGLAKDVDNLFIGSKIGERTNRFSLSDGKVTWFCKFSYGLRSVGAVLVRPKFVATWYGPSNKIFKHETFKNAYGNNDLARNELKLDPNHPEQFIGKWRVEIRYKDEILDEQEFEIVP